MPNFGNQHQPHASPVLAGILHNDIKPENLLLARDSSQSLIKVGDFGLARLIAEFDDPNNWRCYGTPGYMAPEVKTLGQVSAKSDMYSIGVVLYYMLCGRPPFTSKKGDFCCWLVLISAMSQAPALDAVHATTVTSSAAAADVVAACHAMSCPLQCCELCRVQCCGLCRVQCCELCRVLWPCKKRRGGCGQHSLCPCCPPVLVASVSVWC